MQIQIIINQMLVLAINPNKFKNYKGLNQYVSPKKLKTNQQSLIIIIRSIKALNLTEALPIFPVERLTVHLKLILKKVNHFSGINLKNVLSLKSMVITETIAHHLYIIKHIMISLLICHLFKNHL